MIHIYDKNGNYKVSLNYTKVQFEPDWFDEWEEGDIVSETKLNNPIIENGEIREKIREELVNEGKEVELNDGEIIKRKKIVFIEVPNNLIKPKWNKEKKEWEESYNKDEYFRDIDQIKTQVLEQGYTWGDNHNQRCRDKDIALMTSTIEALKDYKELKGSELPLTWYFSDNDGVVMSLSDMQDLRLAGTSFVQKVYKVENILKTEKLQKVTLVQYLDLLSKL